MSEENQTINEDIANPSLAMNPDDLIATVDEPMPNVPSEETKKTDEEVKEEVDKAAAEVEEKPAAQAQEDESRFDKHPRFQELIRSKNELKEQLKTLQTQVEGGLKYKAEDTEDEQGYKDVSKMTADEMREWMEEDPVAYTANIAKQIKSEVTADVEGSFSQRSHEDRILKTFDDYASKDETFDQMWDSGEIGKFLDNNPGHNALSAHMALTSAGNAEKIKIMVEEAVAKAVKETETKMIKNFKAKKGAQVLGSGPASTGTAQGRIAPELKQPKKFGGVNTVLAARLKERRQRQ
jgi:hypothetical protein